MAGFREYFGHGFKLRYFPEDKTLVFVGGPKTNKEELIRTKRKLETLLQIDSTKKNGSEISLKVSPQSMTNIDELIRSMGFNGGLEREDAGAIGADATEEGADQAGQQNAPQPNVAPAMANQTPPEEPEPQPTMESIMPFFFKEDVGMREKGRALGDLMSTKQPFANGMAKDTSDRQEDKFMDEDEIEKELGISDFFFNPDALGESFSLGRVARDPTNYPAYNASSGGDGYGRGNKSFANYMVGDEHRKKNQSNMEDVRVDTIGRENFDVDDELNMPLEEAFKFAPNPVKQRKAKIRKRPGKYWKKLEDVVGKNRYKLTAEDILSNRKDYARKPFSSERNAVLLSLDKAANFFFDFVKRREGESKAEEFWKKYLAIDNLTADDYSENIDDNEFDDTVEDQNPIMGINLPDADFDEIDYSGIDVEN